MPYILTDPDEEEKGYVLLEPEREAAPQAKLRGAEVRSAEEMSQLPWWQRWGAGASLAAQQQYAGNVVAGKGLASGATLGATENIEALRPGVGEETAFGIAKMAGELAPIEGINAAYLKGLGTLTGPAAKFFPMATRALSEIVGAGLTGATVEGTEQLFEGKTPSAEDLVTHGATWASLDAILKGAGKLVDFSKNLISASKRTGIKPIDLASEIASDMKKRYGDINKIENASEKAFESLSRVEEDAAKLKPEKWAAEEPPPIEVKPPKEPEITKEAITDVEQELAKKTREGNLNKIAEEPVNKQALTEEIQASERQKFEEARAAYEPLYQKSRAAMENIMVNPERPGRVAQEIVDYIDSLNTKPSGYETVKSTVNNALKDLGFIELERTIGAPIRFATGDIPLSKVHELGRRLSKTVNYDLEGPSIKKQLNRLTGEVKSFIRDSLQDTNKQAYKDFVQAERLYGQTAEKFGTDSMIKLRNMQNLEAGAKHMTEPTAMKELKGILDRMDFAKIERQALERMQGMSYPKAKDYLREINPYLSKKSQGVANEMLNTMKPKTSRQAVVDKYKKGVLDELSKTQITKTPPKNTLVLWKTEEGRKLVKEILRNEPAKKEIIKYLNQKTFYDFASQFVDSSGRVDMKKLDSFLSNKNFLGLAEEIGGKEGRKFMVDLENRMKSFKENVNAIQKQVEKNKSIREKIRREVSKTPYGKARIEKTKTAIEERLLNRYEREYPIISRAEKLFDSLGVPAKSIIYASGITGLGIVKGAGAILAAKVLYKMLKSPTLRAAFRGASRKGMSSKAALAFLMKLDKELSKSE